MSVRATEELVHKLNAIPDEDEDETKEDNSVEREYYNSLERKMKELIGSSVKISHFGRKKSISISYKDADELEEIIKKLVGEENTENLFE